MTAPISFACLCPRKTQVDTRFQGCQSSLFTVVKRRRAINLYALVDGAQDENLLARLQKHWPIETCVSIYANLPEGASPEVSPLLIPIDPRRYESASTIFRRLLMPQIVKPESLLFLWSESPPEELAEHLGHYAEITTSEDKRALLRFHDPNIWAAALAVQTEAEQAHFFSRLTEVWCPDLDMNWWKYRCQSTIKPADFQAVQWDEARHQRFAALTEPRKILLRFEEEYKDLVPGSRAGWLEKIRGWRDRAATLGARTFDEHLLYCVTALFVGEDFSNAPEVAVELGRVGQDHADLAQAIQAVSPAVWERLETLRQGTPSGL